MKSHRLYLIFVCILLLSWAQVTLGSGSVGSLVISVEGSGTTAPIAETYTILPQTLLDEAAERTVITAYPAAGWQFDEWSVQPDGLVDDTQENPTTLNIGTDYQYVTAVFSAIPGYVDENNNDDGGGGSSGCFIRSFH